jgi:hypothetical protein
VALISSYNGVANAKWTCPKKGIWNVIFNSNYIVGMPANSFVIGKVSPTTKAFGKDYVNTFVVLDIGEGVAVTSVEGSGKQSIVASTLTFNLIMELN